MDKKEELIKLRDEIKKLRYQAANEPAIIRSGGVDLKIATLTSQERELVKTIRYEEEHAAELAAMEEARLLEEQGSGSKKTMLIVGGIAGFIIIASIITAVMLKKRKK